MKANIYSGGSLDRAGELRGDAGWLAERLKHPTTRLIPIWRTQNLICREQTTVRAARLSYADSAWLTEQGSAPLFLGMDQGAAHFALDLHRLADPAELPELDTLGEFAELREVGPLLPQSDGALLAYARGMVHWHRTHGFCGRCGAPTVSTHGGHTRRCTNADCDAEHYPRTDPAVIVLVSAGDHCILGRQARWRPGMFSTLAGFVEPGESLEEAVAREVMEEVGVPVSRLRYHSSQPWPFPSSLMLGYTAETDAVIPLRIDTTELETAEWFTRADLRRLAESGRSLPNPDSIARRLVEDWLANG
ncbi:NAD(+) diphosphatase [Telmatospirillum siberiense]|uniref:NAD(+) diphosphatase n=1 Tax=Telmatospirillum siberiense TaxID=382514 RepID=A0A2N3PN36_9PROT|nr:NAD(+) diphosphatase [Telmatospirillum siberiense]PKU21815.1 NAD(+) diphosphatase [Telmatospirillum siberiense]